KSLQDKNILLHPVLYPNIQLLEKPFYIAEICTSFGADTNQTIQRLQTIPEISIHLWYSGHFNLVFSIEHTNPMIIIEKIQSFLPIKDLRLRKVNNMWYHPPQLFGEQSTISSYNTTIPLLNERQQQVFSYLLQHPTAKILHIHQALGYATKSI